MPILSSFSQIRVIPENLVSNIWAALVDGSSPLFDFGKSTQRIPLFLLLSVLFAMEIFITGFKFLLGQYGGLCNLSNLFQSLILRVEVEYLPHCRFRTNCYNVDVVDNLSKTLLPYLGIMC